MKNSNLHCKIVFSFKVILLLLLCGSQSNVVFSQIDTVNLFTSQDNTLYEDLSGDTSNGRGKFMFAGKNLSGKIRRGVIKYQFVEFLPACVKILNVSLKMHLSGGNAANKTIELRKLRENWGQGSSNAPGLEEDGTLALPFDATWLHQFYSSDPWNTAGGTFSDTASGSTVVGGPGFYTWISTPQMVSDVQGWVNDQTKNFGWLLKGDEASSNTAKRFHTGEADTFSFAPELIVIFEYPEFALFMESIIEGFWNGTTMVEDTIKVKLRNSAAPYAIVDSAKNVCGQFGGRFCFHNASEGSYYIQVNHRNSIETWSSLPVFFGTGDFVFYDFTDSLTKAYGDNMVLKSGKYCLFSGDVNQDGHVNLTDIILTSNNASNFINGYVTSDLNGDNVTNLTDILIASNNSSGFAHKITP